MEFVRRNATNKIMHKMLYLRRLRGSSSPVHAQRIAHFCRLMPVEKRARRAFPPKTKYKKPPRASSRKSVISVCVLLPGLPHSETAISIHCFRFVSISAQTATRTSVVFVNGAISGSMVHEPPQNGLYLTTLTQRRHAQEHPLPAQSTCRDLIKYRGLPTPEHSRGHTPRSTLWSKYT